MVWTRPLATFLGCVAFTTVMSAADHVFAIPATGNSSNTIYVFNTPLSPSTQPVTITNAAAGLRWVLTTVGGRSYVGGPGTTGVFQLDPNFANLQPLGVSNVVTALLGPAGAFRLFLLTTSSLLVYDSHTVPVSQLKGTYPLPAGSTPVGLATDIDAKFVFIVTNNGTGSTVTKVDAGSLTTVATLPLQGQAKAVAMSPKEQLWVSLTAPNQISVIDPLGMTAAPGLTFPMPGPPSKVKFTDDGGFALAFAPVSPGKSRIFAWVGDPKQESVDADEDLDDDSADDDDDVITGDPLFMRTKEGFLLQVNLTPNLSTIPVPVTGVESISRSTDLPATYLYVELGLGGGAESIVSTNTKTQSPGGATSLAQGPHNIFTTNPPVTTGASVVWKYNDNLTVDPGATVRLILRALDANGNRVFLDPVTFTSADALAFSDSAGAKFLATARFTNPSAAPAQPYMVNTNADGFAAVTVTAPGVAGTYHVSASVNGVAQAVTFTFTVSGPNGAPRTISHIADGARFRTTFILLNTGSTAANFTLDFWSDAGGPLTLDLGPDGVIASLSDVIPPHGARFIRTAGSTPGLNKGWAQLTAPPAVDGNSIFGLQTPGQGDSEAAVPLSPAGGTDLFLPFDDTPGFVTGVAFADPGQQAATVAGSFLDDSGTAIVDAHTVAVPAHGHNADVMPNFFPATQGKLGTAHFSAGTNIFGLGIRANGRAFTTIEALSGVTAATKIIAHIASGGGWKTTFVLVNTGTVPAQFTLAFFSDAGSPLSLPLDTGATVSTLTDMIPAGGLRVVKATNTGSLLTGQASLAVTGPISGTAIFALETPGQPDSEAAVPFATGGSTQLYMPFDYSPSYATGIAFANANQSTATVTVTIFDEAGNSLAAPAVVVVPGLGHVSKVLSDPALFPGIAGKRGMVSITSDRVIFALGIRADGVAFTSLKVVAK
ncbi:MAG: hypothetical protein LAO55_26910 [Acidobacteriia bacterium]|nr:hypothetical protein [Terriglobia bacterium]